MRIKILIIVSMLTIVFLPQTVSAKDWRGVVPLKTTRAEVERRFGKPDEKGWYEIKDERASFDYGDGPCKGLYLSLGEDNCKCLADDTAVMSIFVQPTVKRKISELRLNVKQYNKIAISPFPDTFAYENLEEGIVYTVDELEDEVKHITYYPSYSDCREIIAKRAPKIRNSWRGLTPLHSTRNDVEALLGSPNRPGTTLVTYKTDYETVVAKYSNENCDTSSSGWKVATGTLIELVVNPTPSFLLKELHLPSSRYERRENFAYPEVDNPPRVWTYTDQSHGISIRTHSSASAAGDELVVSISYFPSQRNEGLRCRTAWK